MVQNVSGCRQWFWAAVTTLCLWSSIRSQANVPACDFLDENQIVNCYLIGKDSLEVLYDAFQTTSNWSDTSLLITFSEVADFPDDVFLEANLSSLSFEFNSTMAGIPNAMLRSVASPLSRLQFTEVSGIDSVTEADFRDLPFADDLRDLVLQLPELQGVGAAPFQWFTHLQQLTVAETSLTVLPSDFLQGLTDLEELTLIGNPISSLPKNFFAQQTSLRIAWLGDNDLQVLEEGALDGLTNIQMLSVPGNPFDCNCTLQWFKDWLTDRQLLNASGATCQYPYAGSFSEINFCEN